VDTGADSKTGEAMRAAVGRQLENLPAEEKKCTPPVIPDHELLQRIGSGAYGEVWLARSALGTLRAVKVVYRARFKDDRPYEREFHGILKYEPVSRSHEGLVQVLHVGRNDETACFYYVMELADEAERDGPITARRTEDSLLPYHPRTLRSDQGRNLPPTEAASLALRLASALAHLHTHGLVHRDIKPSNVIFVGGQPKLADIGLVTDVGSSHSFVGTEGFIPPEGPGTPQADLYGLGKLLYELATGRDRMDFPQLPPGVPNRLDGEALLDLNEVMTRACAPEPKHRYADAKELQADLNLFLGGRSLRQVRNIERTLARLKRFAMAASLFLLLAAGAIWFFKNEERHAEERARQATERARFEVEGRAKESILRQRAEAAEHTTQQQLYTALLEQARATVRSGELGQRVRTLDAIRRAATISNTTELRREAMAALGLPDLRFERELPLTGDVTLAALDPKFERVAVGRDTNAVEIRSVPDQRLLATLPPSTREQARLGKWSSDGRFLAVHRAGKLRDPPVTVEVWDVESVRCVIILRETPFGALSFHPTRPHVLCSDRENSVGLWDLDSSQEMARFSVIGLVHHLEFSPDGQSFIAQHRIGWPWFTSLFDSATRARRWSKPSSDWVDGMAWDPQDRWVGLAVRTGEIDLRDPKTGAANVIGRHKNEARTATFTPDGHFLFTGGEEQEIICWDLRLKQRAFSIGLQSTHLQVRADGEKCAVITRTGLLLYSFERPVACRELTGDLGGSLRHAAFSPGGRWLAVGGMYRLAVWDLTRDTPAAIAFEAEYAKPFFSPDGVELFAFSAKTLERWRIRSDLDGRPSAPALTPLPVIQTSRVYSGQFISNSLVLGTQDGACIVPAADVASGAVKRFGTHPRSGPVSPNGLWMTARFNRYIHVYQVGPGRVADWIVDGETLANEFTPRSDELAVVTTTGVTFVDTNRWKPKRTLSAALDQNTQLSFTPDGRAFWLAHDARNAALYDTQTFQMLLPLPSGMTPLAVSPDGRYLAVSVDQRRLQVWDLAEVRKQLRELGLDWAGASNQFSVISRP